MIKLQDSLNLKTKPKRDSSYDAGKPRKAAQRLKQKGFVELLGQRKGKASASVSETKNLETSNNSKVQVSALCVFIISFLHEG